MALACAALFTSGCFRRKKYENPITKDTLQPDKVLYDKAIRDIERSRYEVARITLNTLMNTYDTSEYLAKAKLAIADSWFREGGSHGLSQAEAEYKDFILFYPTMEESAEAQNKVCDIHYKQMEKADRDAKHAMRAEDECKLVLTMFPNSKFAPDSQQKLRDIQEVLAESEFRVGFFYHHKGSFPAAANRLQGIVDTYPLYSGADEALWLLGDAYSRMGDRFKEKAAQAFARIVKDYPMSDRVADATQKLQDMERPVPEADPVAVARMKYEIENRQKASTLSHVTGIFTKSPDVRLAAKSGTPSMDNLKPAVPASVPAPMAAATGVSDVTGAVVTDPTALDRNPDARANTPPGGQPDPAQGAAPAAGETSGQPAADAAKTDETQQALPTNRQAKPKKEKKAKKK